MIFNQIKGNINSIDNLNEYHIEKIFINSDDTLKRIFAKEVL